MPRVNQKREKERTRERERERERRKNEDARAQNVGDLMKQRIFQMFCSSRKSKGRLATMAGAKPSVEMSGQKSAKTCGDFMIWKSKVLKSDGFRVLWQFNFQEVTKRSGL